MRYFGNAADVTATTSQKNRPTGRPDRHHKDPTHDMSPDAVGWNNKFDPRAGADIPRFAGFSQNSTETVPSTRREPLTTSHFAGLPQDPPLFPSSRPSEEPVPALDARTTSDHNGGVLESADGSVPFVKYLEGGYACLAK
jgi:hypothetical protein